MHKKIREILPVILMVWPYLFYALCFAIGAMESIGTVLLCIYVVLTIPVYIISIVNAFTYKSADPAKELAHYDMLIKLVHIPFYLTILVTGGMLVGTMALETVLSGSTYEGPFLLGMLVTVAAMLMITSSMYGVSAALKGVRSGQISGGKAVLLSVMHFIFALDVISAIILHASMKKSVPEAVQQNV